MGSPIMPGLLIAKALAAANTYGEVPPYSASWLDSHPEYGDRRELLIDRKLHGAQLAKDNPIAGLASVPLAFGYEAVKAAAMQKRSPLVSNIGKEMIRHVGGALGTTAVSPEWAQDPNDQSRLWSVDATTRPATMEAPVAYTRGVLRGLSQAAALRSGGR
jgi:hypothetical protein